MQRFIQYLPFWQQLTDPERRLLQENIIETNYAQGTVVHGGELDCVGVVFVLSGSLCTSMLSGEGREITLYRLGSNGICVLSASCVLPDITFDVIITAEKDVRALVLPACVLARIMRENIHVQNFINKTACHHFSLAMCAMQQILFEDFDTRLAGFLVRESATGLVIHMTHETIAKHTGSAREVVTRTLNRFAENGLVALKRGAVTIVNLDGLQRMLPKQIYQPSKRLCP